MMKVVISIFKKIQNTHGNNERKKIISENKDNYLFTKCLRFLLDDGIVTGISQKKLNKILVVTDEIFIPKIHTWNDCMDYLSKNNTGTDNDIREIQEFINSQPEQDRDFYKKMVTKTLRIGCDIKMVNAAIPNLIPHWNVMLGSSGEKLKLKSNELFFLSKKMNGNRATWYNGLLISRQGKSFDGMDHIISDISNLGLNNYFIDGELIRKNIDNVTDNENFRIGTGIINSDASNKNEIEFVIFDCFPLADYIEGKSVETYAARKKRLEKISEQISDKSLENIRVVPMVYEGRDVKEIDRWLQYAVAHDWEGLMLNKDTPYESKRTSNLIKIKKFYTMDLPIIDLLEGKGHLKGTLGAVVVQYKNNMVNVGSGFDLDTREEIWANREDYIGKIIEVKYKEISKDKRTGLESIQFPVFVRVRNDKLQVSYE